MRIALHDKTQIADYLCLDKGLHLYSLGDLDPFFWPQTQWFGWLTDKIEALALVYLGQSLPTVLAFGANHAPMQDLLKSLLPILPRRFYLHLSLGLQTQLETEYKLISHGIHSRMILQNPAAVTNYNSGAVKRLDLAEIKAIEALYARSYPGNWFDARMLETGQYRGIYHGSELISIAGIHVYSQAYKVAALGNITTAPNFRGQGLGSLTTAILCQDLLQSVEMIGLNVKSDNQAAIACYQKLGFVEIDRFEEFEAVFNGH
jgi:RimJ/RimL family protein N-acetyltransferase